METGNCKATEELGKALMDSIKPSLIEPDKCISKTDFINGKFEKCGFWSNSEQGCLGCKHEYKYGEK